MTCGVWQIITNICVTYVPKYFFYLNYNEAVIDKMSTFHEMAPNFTYS